MSADDLKKTADDVADKADKSARNLKASTEASVSDLHAKASSFVDDASDKASELYGKARDTVSDAADRLPSASEAVAAGHNAYKSGSRQVLRQVARQPIEALLLAGAIGYLVGWATNRG